ncbi:MAG TPA: hypothetical protein VHC50_02875 [Puia sp.]|nr:hypothetical protein [Puia sp.]
MEFSLKKLVFILFIFNGVVFASPGSSLERINLRLRQQNIQINRDLKLGKLTKDQAKTLKAQVEAIRKAEIADLKQNGTKTLTDAQISQLNEQLNTLSKSIPIE